MNKTKVVQKCNNKDAKKNIEEILGIQNIQTYFPILDNFVDNPDILDSNTSLKLRYNINKLIENKIPKTQSNKSTTPYLKTFCDAILYDNYKGTEINKQLFVKHLPILDVIGFIQNEYTLSSSILPDYKSSLTSEQINNFNNQSYIDAFFGYLGSKLTESGKTPCFGLFYGTYSGLKNRFKFDVTEEYSHTNLKNIIKQNTNFEMEETEIDFEEEKHYNYFKNLEPSETDLNLEKLENLFINEEFKKQHQPNTKMDHKLEKSEKTELSDIESISDIESDRPETFKYIILKNYPVQIICTEKLDFTLDDYVKENTIETNEWLSILFQLCFGLAVAQKRYKFCHNDLHSANVMFKETQEEYFYYKINNTYFKIPTFGKIAKIIDFGRATFQYNDIIYFSSAFDENGDAEGQYDYPQENTLDGCKIKPNYSFDLVRLAISIIEYIEPGTELYNLLKIWMTDKHNRFKINESESFDMYINIAKNMRNAVPIKQFNKKIFKRFIIDKHKIIKNKYIFIF